MSRDIKIDKLVLSAGGTADKLEKSVRLLKIISGMQPVKIKSKKRIPSLNVRPGLEVGCKVTLRREKIAPLLKRLLQTINNEIKEKQIENNCFSFGIPEYIEIPGAEYQRDIGILGFNITVSFSRMGKRVSERKIKRGKIPKKQEVGKEEIIEYMGKHYNLKVIRKEKQEGEKNDSE